MKNFASIVNTMEDNSVMGPEEIIQTQVEVANNSSELESDISTIENTSNMIEQASVAQDNLGELTEYMDHSLENSDNGLNQSEIKIIQTTHESIMKSLGYNSDIPIYNPESFQNQKETRKIAESTLEDLGESFKKLGQQIITALKAGFNMVSEFIGKIINNRPMMEKYLNGLEQRLGTIDTVNKAKTTITAGAALLSLNGKGDSSTAEIILTESVKNVELTKEISKAFNGPPKDADNLINICYNILEKVNHLTQNGKGHGILAGGKAIVVSKINSEESKKLALSVNKDNFSEVSARVKESLKVDLVDNGGVTESMQAPDKADMQRVLAKAKVALSSLRDAEKTRSLIKSFLLLLVKGFADGTMFLHRVIGTNNSKQEARFASIIKDVVFSFNRVMTKVVSTIFSQTFRAIKAASEFIDAGIKNLSPQEKQQDKEQQQQTQ